MESYQSFAQYYDGLMEDARYDERCAYLLALCRRFDHAPGRTLDLACGTGTLTCLLKRAGVDVFGADGSVDMLTEAMSRTLDEGLSILFIHQEMPSLELAGKIDTCVCTLDSINHLTDEHDVQETFCRVGKYMRPGGLFIFDVNTVYKHRAVLADNAYILENDRVFCAWQNTPLENDVVQIDLDFFEEEDGVYFRSSESFCERAYSDEALREMLKQAGFEVLAVYGDLSENPPAPDEQRTIYVARLIRNAECEIRN